MLRTGRRYARRPRTGGQLMCPRCRNGYLVASNDGRLDFAVVTCINCGFEGYGERVEPPLRFRTCRCGAHLGEGVPGPLCPSCYAAAGGPARPCDECGVDISHRDAQARFCFPCAWVRPNLAKRKTRAAGERERRCEDCQADIRERHFRAVMCVACAHNRDNEGKRLRRALASDRGGMGS